MTLRHILSSHVNAYSQASGTPIAKLRLTASFVIPVYNSESSIEHCVRALATQQRRDLIVEVILIDDGSTDNSRKVMKKLASDYSEMLPIRLLLLDERNHAAYARNRGVEASTGDLVCFIDSDVIIPPDYLTTHVRLHEQNTAAITFSLRSNVSSEEIEQVSFPVDSINDFRRDIIHANDSLEDTPYHLKTMHELAELCLTCAVTYRRNDLVYVKGCPENFKGWGYNDTAMAAKVIARGRPVIPALTATVYHMTHAPRSGSELLKQREQQRNKQRYERMKDMKFEDTLSLFLFELEETVS